MQPPNEGRRIQIRVNNRQRTGYWSGTTVGWYVLRQWFEFPATNLDMARDAMRKYFTTLDALHEGRSPEHDPAQGNSQVPAQQPTNPGHR